MDEAVRKGDYQHNEAIMSKFNKGDRVRFIRDFDNYPDERERFDTKRKPIPKGSVGTVAQDDNRMPCIVMDDDYNYGNFKSLSEIEGEDFYATWVGEDSIELAEKLFKSTNKTMNNTNIQERFAELYENEPQKTSRKLGFTKENGMLTEEGERIFVNWLFKINEKEFGETIVKRIKKEIEKDSK